MSIQKVLPGDKVGIGFQKYNSTVDKIITGGTFSNNTLTLTNFDGSQTFVTGVTSTASFTGGTVNGYTNFTAGLNANSFTGGTIFSGSTDLIYLFDPIGAASAVTNSLSGYTLLNVFNNYTGITDTSIDNLNAFSGGMITYTATTQPSISNAITGGTYIVSSSTLNLINNTGGTITITGFTTEYIFSGGTVAGFTDFTGGLLANSFSANTIFSGSTNLIDIFAVKESLSGYIPLSGTSSGNTITGNLEVQAGLYDVGIIQRDSVNDVWNSFYFSTDEGVKIGASDFNGDNGSIISISRYSFDVKSLETTFQGIKYNEATDFSGNFTDQSLPNRLYNDQRYNPLLGFTPINKAGDNNVSSFNFLSNNGIDTTGGTLNVGAVNSSVVNLGTSSSNTQINIGTSGTNTIQIGNSNSIVVISGTVLSEQVTNLNIKDKLITLNNSGSTNSAVGAGFEIEEGGNITGYIKTTGGRDGYLFKAPAWVNDISFLSTPTSPLSLTIPNRSFTFDNITTASTSNGNGFVTVNGSNVVFDNTVYTSLSGFTGYTATTQPSISRSITGGTYVQSSSTLNLINNSGGTISITGLTSSNSGTFTGGTVTGQTIFTNGLSANTFTATTIFSGSTNLLNLFDRIGSASAVTNSLSGYTLLNTFNSFTSTTNTSINNLNTFSGSMITYTATTQPSINRAITGGSYVQSSSTLNLINNTGGTISITGITSSGGGTFTGGTVNGFSTFTNGLSANTLTASTIFSGGTNLLNLFDPIGAASAVTNSLSGYTLLSLFNNFTGSTNTSINNLNSFSGSMLTYTATTQPSISRAITGGTYIVSSSTLNLINNTGATISITGFTSPYTFTGGTVSGQTIFSNGLSANSITASTSIFSGTTNLLNLFDPLGAASAVTNSLSGYTLLTTFNSFTATTNISINNLNSFSGSIITYTATTQPSISRSITGGTYVASSSTLNLINNTGGTISITGFGSSSGGSGSFSGGTVPNDTNFLANILSGSTNLTDLFQSKGNIVTSSTTVTFSGLEDSKSVTIPLSTITTGSTIMLQITVLSNRDLDELEMESFQLAYGNIVANTSFDIIVTNLSGGAEGVYKINYVVYIN